VRLEASAAALTEDQTITEELREEKDGGEEKNKIWSGKMMYEDANLWV
jgi:hypothetical protein